MAEKKIGNKRTVMEEKDNKEPIANKRTKDTTVQLVYLGPNVPRLGLIKNQIYIGGYPENLNELSDADKAIVTKLFVTTKELANAMQEVVTKGTVFNILYEKALMLRKEDK